MDLAVLLIILTGTVLFDEIFNHRLKLTQTLLKILDRRSSNQN